LDFLNSIDKQFIIALEGNKKRYYVKYSEYLGKVNGKPKYKNRYLHRLLFSDRNLTRKDKIDHRNHNTLDNRRNNLRITTDLHNLKNRTAKNKNNTSGYRNVSWCKRKQQWMVQLQINKKNKVLGYFDDKDEAGKFAAEMRALYYGEFAGND